MDGIPPFGRLASGLPLSLPSKETQESQPLSRQSHRRTRNRCVRFLGRDVTGTAFRSTTAGERQAWERPGNKLCPVLRLVPLWVQLVSYLRA